MQIEDCIRNLFITLSHFLGKGGSSCSFMASQTCAIRILITSWVILFFRLDYWLCQWQRYLGYQSFKVGSGHSVGICETVILFIGNRQCTQSFSSGWIQCVCVCACLVLQSHARVCSRCRKERLVISDVSASLDWDKGNGDVGRLLAFGLIEPHFQWTNAKPCCLAWLYHMCSILAQ